MSLDDVLSADYPAWWIEPGHVTDGLAKLPAGSVHCAVTSPPYYGLRSYGTDPRVWGGEPDCEHEWGPDLVLGVGKKGHTAYAGDSRVRWQNPVRRGEAAVTFGAASQGAFCSCGAWRGELGSEPTPDCGRVGMPDEMTLRDNLTDEERAYVVGELLRLGLVR